MSWWPASAERRNAGNRDRARRAHTRRLGERSRIAGERLAIDEYYGLAKRIFLYVSLAPRLPTDLVRDPHRVRSQVLRKLMVLASSLGAGVTALVGFFPDFSKSEALIRIAVVVGAAAFGASLAWSVTARPRTRVSTMVMAILMGGLYGFFNTIPASMILSVSQSERFFACLFFGVVFGVPTGMMYGSVIGLLALLILDPIARDTVDSFERGVLRLSLVSFLGSVLNVAFALTTGTLMFTVALAWAALMLAIVLATLWRRQRRARFMARVRAGTEPRYILRPVHPDDPQTLVRIADGTTVLEWRPEHENESAYRSSAGSVPLAIVND